MHCEAAFIDAWQAANGAVVLVLAHQVDEEMIAGAVDLSKTLNTDAQGRR
jgi:hypothetical protein